MEIIVFPVCLKENWLSILGAIFFVSIIDCSWTFQERGLKTSGEWYQWQRNYEDWEELSFKVGKIPFND